MNTLGLTLPDPVRLTCLAEATPTPHVFVRASFTVTWKGDECGGEILLGPSSDGGLITIRARALLDRIEAAVGLYGAPVPTWGTGLTLDQCVRLTPLNREEVLALLAERLDAPSPGPQEEPPLSEALLASGNWLSGLARAGARRLRVREDNGGEWYVGASKPLLLAGGIKSVTLDSPYPESEASMGERRARRRIVRSVRVAARR